MAQPWKEIMNGGDDERSAVAVLRVGGMHFGPDQQAGGVGDDMPRSRAPRRAPKVPPENSGLR